MVDETDDIRAEHLDRDDVPLAFLIRNGIPPRRMILIPRNTADDQAPPVQHEIALVHDERSGIRTGVTYSSITETFLPCTSTSWHFTV